MSTSTQCSSASGSFTRGTTVVYTSTTSQRASTDVLEFIGRIEQIMYKEIWFVGEPSIYNFGSPGVRESHIQRFLSTVDTRPANFFVERVKTVHFSGYFDEEESVRRVLVACNGLTNLGLYFRVRGEASPEISKLVHSLSLERLFVGSDMLDHILSQIPDSDSCLSNITHLSVVSGNLKQLHLLSFPNLTHLALLSDSEGNFASPLKHARSQPRVKSIVVMISSRPHSHSTLQAREVLKLHHINDSRIVIFTLPMSQKIFFDDDIWDLANEYPDEEEPLVGRSYFLLRFTKLENTHREIPHQYPRTKDSSFLRCS